MLIPNRHGSSNSYRYGFQGQEKDDELKGEGNSLNTEFRQYDPRVGRFFAVDPLTHKYPWYTPYSFSGNKVIAFTELEGAEEKIAIYDSKYKSWKYFSRNDWGLEEDWTNYRTAWLKAISREYNSGTSVAYGYEQYTSNTSNGQIVIPETGMLMIDLSGSYPVYEFSDYDKPKINNNSKSTFAIIKDAFDEKTNPEMVKGINTMKNYVSGVSLVLTGGMSVNINLGTKGLTLLETSVGKAVYETIAQIAVKGDVKSVDISDVAASVLVNNKQARDILKSFVDVSINDGPKLKELNDGLSEYGLRILIDKANPVDGKTGQKYIIDVVKKVELKETKEFLNE